MHLGLIPDGHRRYAREHGISERRSYLLSQEHIDDIVTRCANSADPFDVGTPIDEVTVYAMSEGNLKREDEELDIFYDALREYFAYLTEDKDLTPEAESIFDRTTDIERDRLNIRFISTRPGPLPHDIWEQSRQIEQDYDGDGLCLNILLSYNGRREIAQACQTATDGEPNAITANLALPSEIDYVIRTGDNPRRECLSGFPIWQSSYAEYYHLAKNFPAVTGDDIEEAITHYTALRRNRGV